MKKSLFFPVIIIKKLKYWSLIQKFAKFVVKELENTIIMEVKCVQVAGPFFVEQFKAMVLKVGGNFNPGLFNSKLPPRIVSTPDFSTINFSILWMKYSWLKISGLKNSYFNKQKVNNFLTNI
jgi:hypothetical protein